jgi:hypothetical protein
LKRQLKRAALIDFLWHQATDNWHDGGRERLEISFTRNILHIAPHEEVTNFHMDRLRAIIAEAESEYAPDPEQRTGEYYKELLIAWQVNFFGLIIKLNSLETLNDVFENRLQMDVAITCEKRGDGLFSWLYYYKQKRADLGLTVASEEICRTVYWNLSLVCSGTLVRIEALAVCSRAKYLTGNAENLEPFELLQGQSSPSFLISLALKKKVRSLFQEMFGSGKRLEAGIREEMLVSVADFCSGWRARDRRESPGWAVIRGLSSLFSSKGLHMENSFFHVLDQSLIDFSNFDSEGGTIIRALEFTKEDKRRAMASLFAYLSDCWYFAGDSYLKHRSLWMHGLILAYLTRDGFDWENLREDFPRIQRFIQDEVDRLGVFVINYLKNTVFYREEAIVDFETAAAEIRTEHFKGRGPSELSQDKEYHEKLLSLLYAAAPARFHTLETAMARLFQSAMKRLSVFAFNNMRLTLEENIYRSYANAGLIEMPAPVEREKQRFRQIAIRCGFQERDLKMAFRSYRQIMAGKPYTPR